MNADVVGAVFLIAVATGLVAAHLIRQARTNARHRAVRQQMRAQLLDQLIEAEDFDLWAIELGTDIPVIDIGEWWM